MAAITKRWIALLPRPRVEYNKLRGDHARASFLTKLLVVARVQSTPLGTIFSHSPCPYANKADAEAR